jgi:hypothetical protein
MFIETTSQRISSLQRSEIFASRSSTFRSYRAKDVLHATLAIDIWLLCSQDAGRLG